MKIFKPKNNDKVRITSSSFNRHAVGEEGVITNHVFDLWDFTGSDGLHSVFTPDEFEIILNDLNDEKDDKSSR